jgi:hypothetical protein
MIIRKVKTAAAVFPALLSVPEYRYVVVHRTINMQSRMTRDTAITAKVKNYYYYFGTQNLPTSFFLPT